MKKLILSMVMAVALAGCAGLAPSQRESSGSAEFYKDTRLCQQEIDQLFAEQKLVKGMSHDDVVQALGEPGSKRPDNRAVDVDEVWWYPCRSKGIQAFFGNGKLVAVYATLPTVERSYYRPSYRPSYRPGHK